ncbi:MAG: S41 family peptidase [Bacteroidales bacterium]
MKRLIILSLLVIPVLAGCKKDPPPEPVDEYTFEERARDGLYDLMKYAYLWNSSMPTVKLSDYNSPEDILEAVRYKPRDKWSFVTDYESFMASMQGTFVGHGIRMSLDNSNNVRIASLYEGSDLWPQGVRRGWIVREVNDTPIAPIFISGTNEAYNTLMGPSTAGITNKFLFQKPDGTTVTFTSTKATFTINSVTAAKVLDLTSGKTGYLCFETFIEPSEQELNEAFAVFKASNVTDLIIDLRYNTGGYMDIAQQLSSLVMKPEDTTKICYKLRYNSLVGPEWNESYKFVRTASPLGLNRVVFITTRSSASASEVVINSLKPYVNVTIVGDTTHGKPAGMNIWGYPFPSNSDPNPDYQYVFAPITFEYVNSSDEGQFYSGMLPDVKAADDITHDFGDPQEASLAAAIAVLQGTKAKSSIPVRRNRIYSEGDQLPSNLFLGPPQPFKK